MPGWSTACFGSFKKIGETFYNKNNLDQIEENRTDAISDDKRDTLIVELEKKDGMTLGLIISGGIDKNSRPKISNLRPGSIAYRCDALDVGDYIISVNGIRTSKLRHEEIVNLLKNAGSKVTLEIEYETPVLFNNTSHYNSKVIQVKLEKEKDSFGFTLRSGPYNDRLKSRPLIITDIKFGGPAHRTGVLKTCDRILAVDGVNLSSASLTEALQLLKQVKQSAIITVEYDVQLLDAVKNASGPLLVEIDKAPGSLLGLTLSCLSVPEHAIVIESIRQASIAERCGALHVGDHVLAINGIKLDMLTSAEAMELLRSSAGDTVKLEILPVSQIALRSGPDSAAKRDIMSTHYSAARTSFGNNSYNTLSSVGEISLSSGCPYASITPPFVLKRNYDLPTNGCNSAFDSIAQYSFDASFNPSSCPNSATVARADRTEVILHADHKGFGFHIYGPSHSSDILTTPPVINCIDQGSPAERSGVLLVGDRVLAINGDSTEGMSIERITNMIANSHPRISLITEFDVAEAVVPSSGIFVVKLAKKGADLGISLTAPRNRQYGEPLIIADVQKGSIAHRTGTIQPGDKLLAINSLRTENLTVEDSTAILHTCTDIVKLRIRKDETFSEDPDTTCAIVYTVELVRHGGPLGITVSGTKEPFDPIFISGLTENGLAERTGALHVGDRILAINGHSLRGKTLNEAICILQTCGDTVTLKISKCPCAEKPEDANTKMKGIHCMPDNHMKTFSTPLSSVDSAVDSWDSCNPRLVPDVTHTESDEYSQSSNHNIVSISYPNTLEQTKYKTTERDNRQIFCEQKNPRRNSYSGNLSVPSEDEKESWHKVLEDLQTCGESRLLRQLEESILGHEKSPDEERTTQGEDAENNLKCSTDTLSENNLLELNSQIEQLNVGFENNGSFPDVISQFKQNECNFRHSMCNDNPSFYCNPSSSFAAPLPIEIQKVTLFKDPVYEDFGFSLSDGKYESGVYINSIRPGGPADISGLIKPLDRILQVNNVKTYNAGLIVPLIASSGDRIELIISRPAYDDESSSEGTLERSRTSNCNAWADDDGEKDDNTSLFCPISENKTFTKTL
ncbi:glutamate receptor-interacting protein 2-like isoform X3 [Argiope bruennichi]|uniref:glutamate receptor-interacting protein 2-like isoform X3 n=1 Tax=Argiope bruennichi TaxID=94029 RepID=UPI00249530EE|nr:glutamate receptor-interacting protein 2-like isoform X3 [Argiope bruennichi]